MTAHATPISVPATRKRRQRDDHGEAVRDAHDVADDAYVDIEQHMAAAMARD
jgi:hypothetical protein